MILTAVFGSFGQLSVSLALGCYAIKLVKNLFSQLFKNISNFAQFLRGIFVSHRKIVILYARAHTETGQVFSEAA